MKLIESFGFWVTCWWTHILVVVLVGALSYSIWLAPHSVSLSEKEFKCVEAEPFGLTTRCVTYTRRVR
jgi:hypothetical protein